MIIKLKFFAFLFLFLMLPLNAVTAAEDSTSEAKIIETYEEDVTGDGVDEVIKLKGTLFSSDSNYWNHVWAEVASNDDETWEITYEGGYEPNLQFIDLNHDNSKDILYQSATGGSGGLYNYQLNSLSGGELTEIPLPIQDYLTGEFTEQFTVLIQLTPYQEPIHVDVSDRAEDYIRLGIYNENGDLLEATSVMIDPIAFFEPVRISEEKGYGLKSYQQISGAYHADGLGTVESLWYFEDGKWTILQTEWVPSGGK